MAISPFISTQRKQHAPVGDTPGLYPRLSRPQRLCPVLKQPGSTLWAEHQGLACWFLTLLPTVALPGHFRHVGLDHGTWEERGPRSKPTRLPPRTPISPLFPTFSGLGTIPGLPNGAVFQLAFSLKV